MDSNYDHVYVNILSTILWINVYGIMEFRSKCIYLFMILNLKINLA